MPRRPPTRIRLPSKPHRPSLQRPAHQQPPPSKPPKPEQPSQSSTSPNPSHSASPFFTARTLRSGASIAFISFCAAIFFRDKFYTIDSVNGSSMAPTLSPLAHETGAKDRIFIKRRFDCRDIQRGDIITFWKPHKQSEISIKRVVGVEGDTVYPHRGYACDPELVNGRRVEGWDGLGSREWALGGDGEVEVGKVVVPNGHVWVEGDNWRRSYDSCDFGPVSLGLVDGKAMWVWRDWLQLQPVGDEREKGRSHSMVVAGTGRVESRLSKVFDE
ncbi:hypothetical protein PMIN06_011483 [Paraphaeosphaeria minitans]|uniref:Mitochondrial inner membrane protease subunit n=1 Tax=Paraphaeosphaeria minitans TaxID=565426 RepID=A0A9P6KK94_9PLEO|nr:hypothetical protein PMIN01_13061 [Paraphaeosphaeria minitans]